MHLSFPLATPSTGTLQSFCTSAVPLCPPLSPTALISLFGVLQTSAPYPRLQAAAGTLPGPWPRWPGPSASGYSPSSSGPLCLAWGPLDCGHPPPHPRGHTVGVLALLWKPGSAPPTTPTPGLRRGWSLLPLVGPLWSWVSLCFQPATPPHSHPHYPLLLGPGPRHPDKWGRGRRGGGGQ